MAEKIYEKYAWIAFFALGSIFLVTAIPHALGYNTDPALVENLGGMTPDELKDSNPMFFDLYSFYLMGGALSDIGFAFLITVVSATAYRRGEKWAWYAFWFIPVYFIAFIALSLAFESSSSVMIPPLMVFVVVSLVGLLLPFRKFFPSKAQ
ncbi:MAG: hypothetical protein JSU93_00910 [Methanobacteriota archaeon]|nr:MAG: hypothetical protein JSU93_00910 [Euryarchaeota archaeon]